METAFQKKATGSILPLFSFSEDYTNYKIKAEEK